MPATSRILALAAAISALTLLTAPATAQKYTDEIVVTPPVYSNGVYGPRGRERAEVVVSTRDLDLRSNVDAAILYDRIRDGARLACNVLDNAVGMGARGTSDCRRDAQRDAMREARLMVDYARG